MAEVPQLQVPSGIQKVVQIQFGGLAHYDAAKDGQIYDMQNITGDNYPILQPRQKRRLVSEGQNETAIFAHEKLVEVKGTQLLYDGVPVGTVTPGKKIFASMGARILIWPDKAILNVKGNTPIFGKIEQTVHLTSITIKDGIYQEEEAAANTLKASGVTWSNFFKEGDAVTIEGLTQVPANNKTPIIREIAGDELRFYENVFKIPNDAASYTETGSITVSRTAPDLDDLCVLDNRAWGIKGDTIYASKLGDPANWNVYDGLSTDSYFVEGGTPGEFTGCFAYLGYPCFFKENEILKMYGTKPSNFQLQSSAATGLKKGAADSIAVAGEMLFYLAREGFCIYTGGMPESAALAFGQMRFTKAVAGATETKYYVSAEHLGNWMTYVYDTKAGQWFIEDDLQAVQFANVKGKLYCLDAEGKLWILNDEEGTEEAVESFVELADIYEQTMNRKYVSRIQVRIELEEGAELEIKIQYDNQTAWKTVKKFDRAIARRSFWLPVRIRRCDRYRIRIEGKGGWKIHAMAREFYEGSEHH